MSRCLRNSSTVGSLGNSHVFVSYYHGTVHIRTASSPQKQRSLRKPPPSRLDGLVALLVARFVTGGKPPVSSETSGLARLALAVLTSPVFTVTRSARDELPLTTFAETSRARPLPVPPTVGRRLAIASFQRVNGDTLFSPARLSGNWQAESPVFQFVTGPLSRKAGYRVSQGMTPRKFVSDHARSTNVSRADLNVYTSVSPG